MPSSSQVQVSGGASKAVPQYSEAPPPQGRFRAALAQARQAVTGFLQHPVATLKSIVQRDVQTGQSPAPRARGSAHEGSGEILAYTPEDKGGSPRTVVPERAPPPRPKVLQDPVDTRPKPDQLPRLPQGLKSQIEKFPFEDVLETAAKPLDAELPGWVKDAVSADKLLFAQTQLAPPRQEKVFSEPRLQQLDAATLQSGEVKQAYASLAQALRSGGSGDVRAAAQRLGHALGEPLGVLPRAAQQQFALAQGGPFLQDLLDQLRVSQPKLPATLAKLSPLQRDALLQVMDTAATHADDAVLGDGSLQIGGKVYRKQGDSLGEGHFGAVTLYKADDGSTLAVKQALRETTDLAPEGRAMMESQGHPNVMDLSAVVRTANGGILLAMPVATGGTAANLLDAVHKALAERRITPEQARAVELTVLQDVLRGAQHLQADKGLVHHDLRGANALVDGVGLVKVADFGLARDTRTQELAPKSFPKGTTAPEVIKGKAPANPKSDVFSLGKMLGQALFGEVEMKPVSAPKGASPEVKAQARLGVGVAAKLIGAMTHPDPAQRPTLQAVLGSVLFDEPGVGSNETRRLIRQLSGTLPAKPDTTPGYGQSSARTVELPPSPAKAMGYSTVIPAPPPTID